LGVAELALLAAHQVGVHRDYAAGIAALTVVGFVAPGRRDLPPRPFRLPFDWNADPFGDRNWMFHLHAWRMLDPHLNRLLAEPGHPDALPSIEAVVADWNRDNLCGRPGRFTWYDMSTGLRALKLALLVGAVERQKCDFTDPGLIAGLVDRHMDELARPETLSDGNHGLFQLSGLMALAWQHPGHPRAAAARDFAAGKMTTLIDRQLGPAGVHTEDSPDYHFFATGLIGRILQAPWWQLDALAPFRGRLAAAAWAGNWLVDPAGRCLPVGDSSESVRIRDFAGLRRWPHRRRHRALGAVVDGYAVVRTDPALPVARSVILFLTASFHREAHKHSDCLSLIWQEGGENLLVDSGKYGYQRDLMRAYFLSSRAHNTIEVNGRSFSRRTAHAYGSGVCAVRPLGATWLVEAEARHDHEGILHQRRVLFRPHRFLLAVDRVAATLPTSQMERLRRLVSRQRTIASWWHFNPDHAVASDADPYARRLVSGLARGRRLFVSHVGSGGEARVEIQRGASRPRVQGWVSRAYLKCEPATAVGFIASGGADFVAATLFELTGPGNAPGLALRWDPGAGRIALSDESDPGPRTAAQAFAAGKFAIDIPEALL
jgi:hypothetical protein